MAENFPGPYQLRVFYDVAPGAAGDLTHVLRINMDVDEVPDPGDLFAEIVIKRRVGAAVLLSTVTDSLVTVFRDIQSLADCAILYAEFWGYEPGTNNAAYISTYDISLAGTDAGQSFEAWSQIFTFRTLEGGVMKIYVMEGITEDKDRKSYTDLSAEEQAFADWFTDDITAYALGRDTSYPWQFLRMSPGEHEALFQKRFRP